ncbi:MAG: putative transposase [Planctomycetota bacterium]|jgi:transposase
MPQQILPLIPRGATQINGLVSVFRDDESWTYFLATHPIYSHRKNDQRMFRLITSQLIDSGACRQVNIQSAFGVSKSSVIRSLNKLRSGGPEAFFVQHRGRRGGKVLTSDVLDKAQWLLDQGYTRNDAAKELGVQYDTFRKAINDGRLMEHPHSEAVITKSSRNMADAAAADGMGVGCTRVVERVLASLGKLIGATVRFETCLDVPKAGVLCALPALLTNGLFNGARQLLGTVTGYYTTFHVLLLLSFMALCRIKTAEKLRGHAPGEFGKLLGLDRVPEVRCLRHKMDELSANDGAERWAAHLGKYWMKQEPESVGALYVDGHVRVYHGRLTKLPRRYVSRERLCLRGITDYWVNDAIGRPFFVIEKEIDPGLLNTLRHDIVPRLLEEVPDQASSEQLCQDPYLCRFILVFDREGYSPAFFYEMWSKHRVACLTYHKHPSKPWPEQWFTEHKVTMPGGELVTMQLCEMGSCLGSGKDAIWMREVRKLTDSGHQTSLISTAFDLPHTQLAARMFSRWCQENFFNYMMQHFDIDVLLEYGGTQFPDTEKVVNPTWRQLNRSRNSLQNKLRYRRAHFAEMAMHPETEEKSAKYRNWLKKKADLLEEIENFEYELKELKAKLKDTSKHITWGRLDEKDKFLRLLPGRKRLMDTIRMIAYRAETAMVGLITGAVVDSSDARRLLQDLFVTEADILPDPENKQLNIRVHSASRPAANRALEQLFGHLNKAEVNYPGTDMRLAYALGGYTGCNGAGGVT